MDEQSAVPAIDSLTLDTEDIVNIIDTAITYVCNRNRASCSALDLACSTLLEEYSGVLILAIQRQLNASYRAYSKARSHSEGFTDISMDDWRILYKEDTIHIRVTKLLYYKFHVMLNNVTFAVTI